MNALPYLFTLLRIFTLRHMLRHRWRVATVLLGIALGAAVFTSVRLSIHTCLAAADLSLNHMAGNTEMSVYNPGGRVPESLVAELFADPRVRTASPMMTVHVTAGKKGERKGEGQNTSFLLVGIDPLLDRPLRQWRLSAKAAGTEAEGSNWRALMASSKNLVMGTPLLLETGLSPGDSVTLRTGARQSEFSISGSLDLHGVARAGGGRIAICDIATFQEFIGIFGEVDRVDLLFNGGWTETLRKGLEAKLPAGILMAPPTEAMESGRTLIRAYGLNLSVLSFVSLFVGMFLIYSLVSLNAAARRREIAILRSLGAPSGWIFGIFLLEGGMLGVLGWLVAIPASTFLVRHLLSGISRTISSLFTKVTVEGVAIAGWELTASFLLTVGVSLLAAWQPARRAMAVPPAEAMGPMPKVATGEGKFSRSGACALLLILLVWPVSKIPAVSGIPLSGYFATFLLFAGFSLLSPWALAGGAAVLLPVLSRIGGEPARLAGGYVRAGGSRTAVAVGALVVAVALFGSLVIMIESFRGSVALWAEQTVSGDLFVRPALAGVNRYREPIPVKMAETLAEMGAKTDLVPYYRVYTRKGTISYMFEAMDLATFTRHGGFSWVSGTPEAALRQAVRGEGVLISEVFASRMGLTIGDTYSDRIDGKKLSLPILGIFRDFRTRGGVVMSDYAALGPGAEGLWGGVRFFLREKDASSEAVLDALVAEIRSNFSGKLNITRGKILRRGILETFEETFALTTVLLVIALVVAGLGIATTLAVLVMERSRQLNTIIAVGGSAGQVRAMILWEALIVVATGQVFGMVCGFGLSWLLIYVINYQSFGWTFLYRVDWPALLSSLPLVLLTGFLAAIPAVSLVFRQSPAELLREG